jgi:hypothetical protein
MGWHCRLDFPEVLVDGFRSCWVLILMSFFSSMPLYIYLLQQCWGGVMVRGDRRVLPGLEKQTRVNTEYKYLPQTSKQHCYLTCSSLGMVKHGHSNLSIAVVRDWPAYL